MVLTPLAVLGALELTLRIAGYDRDLDLIHLEQSGNREYYVLNRSAGRRYFTASDAVIPELHEDRFSVQKGPRTKRVFCLGESTMEGFPYEFNPTPPYLLRDRLRAALPMDTIEVLNVGLSAIGSYVVLDFMQELLRYKPDLFVVYLGHNEFYGVYGPGSAISMHGSAWITRLTISLLHYKTYLLLRDGYEWLAGRLGRHVPATGTLMQQMVGKGEIRYHSQVYDEARSAYEANLNALIDLAQSRGVPILFSSLVSNIRDQPPFVSLHPPGFSDSLRMKWETEMNGARQAEMNRDTGAAVEAFSRATGLDSMYALGYFELGKDLYGTGRYGDALRAFQHAKDLDALRFRATEEFQQTLVTVCRVRGVPLARVDSAFAVASPHGIVGHELILEHLHPNISGYRLMAKVWADAIRDNDLLEPSARWQPPYPDSVYDELSAVTAFDDTLGMMKIRILTHHWPFHDSAVAVPRIPLDSVSRLCYAVLEKQIPWSEARYQLAGLYARHHRYGQARRECMAVAKAIPYSFQPLLRVADYYVDEGNTNAAEQTYRQCVAVEDNPFAHMKLGLICLNTDRPAEAVREIERGFSVDSDLGGKMQPDASATGRYLLGIAYANIGKYNEARKNLGRALAIEPGLKEARALLDRLERGR